MRITRWNWSKDNKSTVPTYSTVWEETQDDLLVNGLLQTIGHDRQRPIKTEYDEHDNTIYIIGGDLQQELDVIYVETTVQLPMTFVSGAGV